ncbi:MAG: iron ABC transporter permease [Acidimicrobiia bacterium]|nr:MAG: iron ABC transporter permease [Acidimicrobiia bacterium]
MTLRRGALVALPLGFLAIFYVYPVVSILLTGLVEDGLFDFTPFVEVLRSPSFRGVAWFTIWQAVASTALTVLAAMPIAYVLARYEFPGKRLISALLTVPFVMPTVVVGSAFLALLGSQSPIGINLSRTIWIIFAAHVFFNLSVVVRTVGGLWSHLDPRLEEAARSLGATRWQAFRTTTLPLLRPALVAATSIVFLFTFTSFGVILILGGLTYATLEVEIYRQTTAVLNFPIAAALAIVQLVGVTAILWFYTRYQRRRDVGLSLLPAGSVARRPSTLRQRLTVTATIAYLAVLVLVPLAVLVGRSFDAGSPLRFYQALTETGTGSTAFVSPLEAIGNSLWIAATATVIALVIGMSAAAVVAYSEGRAARSFDLLLMLPLGTSAVTIGFGMLIALDWPVDLRANVLLIPLAHALVAIPFVVRLSVPVMRSVQPRLREAAAMLGASPARIWREIDLPIAARALAVSAGFAFAISLGEFGATSFIARPDTPTLPIAIIRLLGRPGALNFGQAMAMSTILMAVTAAVVLLVDRMRIRDVGEF